MILTAHQPVYLPWLGLFDKIDMADEFVSFNQVQYLPKDWNNRNKIKTPQGSQWLSVPVLRKGYRDMPISQLEINNRIPWQRKHWRSIETNYGKAPYFDNYAPFFEDVYKQEWQFLSDLNEHMLTWFLNTLGINVKFHKASDFDFSGKKSDLTLDMCKQLNADVYIFGSLGKDYARVEDFEKSNIEVMFQDYKHPTYKQIHGDFEPYLSIIDLLFNAGPDSLKILRNR